MPRYMVERVFGEVEQEEMQGIGERMKRVNAEQFPDITWEHSHVVSDETGIKTYCVYEAPNEERLYEAGDAVGRHTISRIYVIAGDVSPADFLS
jgi:Nickel responsive protein SCO4226-like